MTGDFRYPTAAEREAAARPSPLHLSIPPAPPDWLGLTPTRVKVRADHSLEAVEIAFADASRVLLSRPAAIAVVCRLIEAVDDLRARA